MMICKDNTWTWYLVFGSNSILVESERSNRYFNESIFLVHFQYFLWFISFIDFNNIFSHFSELLMTVNHTVFIRIKLFVECMLKFISLGYTFVTHPRTFLITNFSYDLNFHCSKTNRIYQQYSPLPSTNPSL